MSTGGSRRYAGPDARNWTDDGRVDKPYFEFDIDSPPKRFEEWLASKPPSYASHYKIALESWLAALSAKERVG